MDLQEVSPRCSFFSSILHPNGRSSIRERHPLHGYKKSIEQIRFSGYDPALFFGVVPADPVADGLTPIPEFDGDGLSVSRQSGLDRSISTQERSCPEYKTRQRMRRNPTLRKPQPQQIWMKSNMSTG